MYSPTGTVCAHTPTKKGRMPNAPTPGRFTVRSQRAGHRPAPTRRNGWRGQRIWAMTGRLPFGYDVLQSLGFDKLNLSSIAMTRENFGGRLPCGDDVRFNTRRMPCAPTRREMCGIIAVVSWLSRYCGCPLCSASEMLREGKPLGRVNIRKRFSILNWKIP